MVVSDRIARSRTRCASPREFRKRNEPGAPISARGRIGRPPVATHRKLYVSSEPSEKVTRFFAASTRRARFPPRSFTLRSARSFPWGSATPDSSRSPETRSGSRGRRYGAACSSVARITSASLSSLRAALAAARKLDKDAEVILATEEHAAPYLRPLLPDLVSGERELSGVADPQGKDLADLKVKLLGGKRARRVDAAKNRVTFSDGSEETYNFLCVATGGRPILPLALMGAPGSFLFLNSLGDAQRVRERAMRSDTTVVYGPGYLGIEAARAMRKLGNQVIWINPGLPRFGNPISGDVEARVTDQLRARGVKVHEGTEIADVIDVDGKNFEVVTAGGVAIRCSLIVVATERLPNIGFIEGSGVKAGAGVLVDEYLRTNVSNIYAAGDCAEVYDINRRESRINFGWRSAIKQGQLAGENMAGGGKIYIKNAEDYFGLLFGAPLPERVGA